MALSHCMAVALAYRFEFKQYSNRLIIHQLCDFNMAPHAASNLSCCRYVMRVFVERYFVDKIIYHTIRDEYEMVLDTMIGFLLHIHAATSMSINVFSAKCLNQQRKGYKG